MITKKKKHQPLLDQELVSVSLRKALRLADQLGVEGLRDWCRLELGGYLTSNPVMNNDTIVPEYRSIVGQHMDIYGHPLIVPVELSFVNETRLRNGVEELETLSSTRDVVMIHDPHMCELLQRHLNVQVYAFRFSRVHLIGILSAIRLELDDRLRELGSQVTIDGVQDSSEENEILELRPNLYGIGINLRALWRHWKGQGQ